MSEERSVLVGRWCGYVNFTSGRGGAIVSFTSERGGDVRRRRRKWCGEQGAAAGSPL